MSNRRILILGGGVAGASMAYYLGEKGYEVTIVEKNDRVGGLARTCTYGGHPYEFGPHIWFWPGGPDAPINQTIVRLTKMSSSISTGGSSPTSKPTAGSTATRCTIRTSPRCPIATGSTGSSPSIATRS